MAGHGGLTKRMVFIYFHKRVNYYFYHYFFYYYYYYFYYYYY